MIDNDVVLVRALLDRIKSDRKLLDSIASRDISLTGLIYSNTGDRDHQPVIIQVERRDYDGKYSGIEVKGQRRGMNEEEIARLDMWNEQSKFRLEA